MLYFIVNAISGKGNGENTAKSIKKILEEKQIQFKMIFTKARNHAVSLAKELSQKSDCTGIVAVGGDGTFSEVLNGIDTKIPLGLVSSGSGNDFMRTFNKNASLEQQLQPIIENKTKKIDFIQTESRRCLNILGTGFDVDILIKEHKIRKVFKGSFSYYLSLALTLFTLKFRNFKIKIDNKIEIDEPCLLSVMANGKYFGGGIKISPTSKIDDGIMQLLYVKKVPFYAIPNLLIHLTKGTLITVTKYVKVFDCNEVSCSVSPKVDIQVDGELISMPSFTAKIVKNGLTVFG